MTSTAESEVHSQVWVLSATTVAMTASRQFQATVNQASATAWRRNRL
jgi:hypothetical protein